MAAAYARLHHLGWAHSFETWRDGELVGGLYGVAIGRVFFGESMFTRATDASKVALVHASKSLARAELRAHRLPSRVRARHDPRSLERSARRILARSTSSASRAARRDVAPSARVTRGRHRARTRRLGRLPRLAPLVQQCAALIGPRQTVAEWQKKKQFKWKVR